MSTDGDSGTHYDSALSSPAVEFVAPLAVSANRWAPTSLGRKGQFVDPGSPEAVDRKVRSLLNKLTMERFDPISDQIIAWANRSEKEKDGRTLVQVIRLVFEKATDGETWSEICARLCRKMMEQISPNVQDDGIKNAEGRPIAGGQLFSKYLLNRCQEDFERGWVAPEATSTATAEKARRQGLGLVKFIGELFKLQMLTERIMHECIKKLLKNPDEQEIERLCTLLTTVGQVLDTQKARAHMDVYFSRTKELTKSPNVNSRMQFMLQDIIELRERKWIPRNAMAAPTTIAAIHEQAAKEKLAQEKEAFTRQLSMSRGGSRRGGERGNHAQIGPDGWAVADGAATRPASKAGDLSKFGKIDKSAPMTFGPSSLFQKSDKSKSSESTIRQGSTNMFSMLSGNPRLTASEVAGKSNRAPYRIDSDESDEKLSGPPLMSEAEARARIEQDAIEFFAIRDLDEAETYFAYLPSRYEHLLVDRLVMRAVESKPADAQLVADLFERAVARKLCSPASFEEGFAPTAEIIDDIAIDAPKALDLFAIMIKGAHLHLDVERRTRLASKSKDGNKLVRTVLGAARHRISTEAANELIERSVVLLSDLHDVKASLAVFDELPRSYHSQLVERLVTEAMEPGTHSMRAQVLAYFFGWAVERRLCSTAAFEEGVWSTTSALEHIAADVPDALERYAAIVKAMGLHEDPIWRAHVFEKAACHGPELAALFSVV